ncbi:Fe2OG dioxygenase domain-containing protein [Balamuthia mandrillaris]
MLKKVFSRSAGSTDRSPPEAAKPIGNGVVGNGPQFIDELATEVAFLILSFLPLLDKLNLRCASSRWLALVHASCPVLHRAVNVAALRGLCSSLSAQEGLFCCSGTTPLAQPLQLFFHKPQQQQQQEEEVAEQGTCRFLSFPLVPKGKTTGGVVEREREALKELMACCSPFGRGSKQVLDASYYHALQLSSAWFTTNFRLAEYNLLDKIKRVIAPQSWGIRAELHKLNVYHPGEHLSSSCSNFNTREAAESEDWLFASLVVCLPTYSEGGELRVRHGQFEKVFPFDSRGEGSGEGEPSKEDKKDNGGRGSGTTTGCELKWVAFFGDCESEVQRVREGHRITLTYNLYCNTNREPTKKKHKKRTKKAKARKQKQPVVDVEWMRKKLEAILMDKHCFPEGVTLAFQCRHKYACEEVPQPPDPEFISLLPHTYYSYAGTEALPAPDLSCLLKGFDALVYEAAESLDLKTSLKCFFAHYLNNRKDRPPVLLMCDPFPRTVNLSDNDVDKDLGFLSKNFWLRLLVDAVPGDNVNRHREWQVQQLVHQCGFSRHTAHLMVKHSAEYKEYANVCSPERIARLEKELGQALPKKVVQWCTHMPIHTTDTLIAVRPKANRACYVSALLLVKVPSWEQRSGLSPNRKAKGRKKGKKKRKQKFTL